MTEKNSADIKTISTAALAYLGDCVIEICTRTFLVEIGISSSRHLNAEALNFVRAPEQAEAMHRILELLTEEEEGAYRRGRNIGHTNTPKNCTMAQYRQATGFEALFGYLHLEGKQERITELFDIAYAPTLAEIKNKQENL